MTARPSVIVHDFIVSRSPAADPVHAAHATRDTRTDRWLLTTPESTGVYLPPAATDEDAARAVQEAGDAYLAMKDAHKAATDRFQGSLETIAQCHQALPGMETTR